LIIFGSSEGETLDKGLGDKRSAQYLHLFELMLLLEYFCKSDELKRSSINLMKKTMPNILETLKNTLDRQVGNGMKIIKFHLPLHFADDIQRFGTMANYDSGICESHHKDFAKQPASNTQRRKNVFEIQTAKRLVENMAIDRAYETIGLLDNDGQQSQANVNKGFKYAYCRQTQSIIRTGKKKGNKQKIRWNDFDLQCRINTICEKLFREHKLEDNIHFFTQHNRDDIIFRADPSYNQSSTQDWHDWAYISWGLPDTNMVPAKLLIFIEVSESMFKNPFQIGDGFIEEPGSYALVYSFVSNTEQKAHLDSMLMTYGILEQDNKLQKPKIYPVPVHSISGPCIAVPFKVDENPNIACEWLILQSRQSWNDTFIKFMENLH
jgi:hypothetical protein